jgi:hypothetical protein
MAYVPEGGGSHHWKVTGEDGLARFVTVDDLGGKDWLGDTREAAFGGLGRALGTAAALRDRAGLDFVVAPPAARDGGLPRRAGDRYAVCVFPFLAGRSFRFGPYADPLPRDAALDMIAALHQATPAVRDLAPRHVLGFTGRDDLDAFLAGRGPAVGRRPVLYPDGWNSSAESRSGGSHLPVRASRRRCSSARATAFWVRVIA